MKKSCAITFGITDNYTFALANVLLGIKKYTTPFWDAIFVFHTNVSEEHQNVIQATLPCQFVRVQADDWCKQLEQKLGSDTLKMYSLATLFRYFCFKYLDEYRKVIWLDCDLLIQNDISGIGNYGEKTGFAACMADRMAPVEMCYKHLIPGYQMFIPLVNAGTLVLTDVLPHYSDMCQWCMDKTVELAKDLDMPDQGVLNLLLQEYSIEVEPIDVTKYQCHPEAPEALSRQMSFIVHAYGIRKFWNDAAYQEMFPEWQIFNREYMKISEAVTHQTCMNQGELPLVSVIMSSYTRDNFLDEAVDSILAQTYVKFEFIVVVEYSEKQQDIVQKLEAKRDARIVVICNREKLGFAKSLNIGIDAAKGKYIARMDDDDRSYPARLQKQVVYMEGHPEIGILGTFAETFMNCHDVWTNYPVDPEDAAIALLRGTVLCHPTVMIRKSALDTYQLRYDPTVFTEDYDLWARAVKHIKISNLPEVLYSYRASGKNITVNQEAKVHRAHLEVMRWQFQNYLHIMPSDDELCLFNGRIDTKALVYTKHRTEAENIYEAFVYKISNANQKVRFYNQEKLEIYLGLRNAQDASGKDCMGHQLNAAISYKKRIKRTVKAFLKPFVDRVALVLSRPARDLVNAQTHALHGRMDSLMKRMQEVETSVNIHAAWNTDDVKKELFNFRFLFEKHNNITPVQTDSIYSPEFYENNRYHSYQSAIEVFTKLLPVLSSQSVFDFGCGSGTWLYAAKRFGVKRVHGVDGSWVDRTMLMIDKDEFEAGDVSAPYVYQGGTSDLVCSLEVAEHIAREKADIFIDNLCGLGDVILFSAAHPGQGGDGHVNEQPYEYWEHKFRLRGYHLIDIRTIFAENEKICSWYRENIALYVQADQRVSIRKLIFNNQ